MGGEGGDIAGSGADDGNGDDMMLMLVARMLVMVAMTSDANG